MKSVFKFNLTVILSVVLLVSVSQSATLLPVIDISGGEDHTLVLGKSGQAFACGERSRTVEGTLQLFPPSATAATTIPRNLFLSTISSDSHPASSDFQSNLQGGKSKNEIFQNFLILFHISTYKF